MSHTIPIDQAPAQLIGLVRTLGPGDEIILTETDKPIARILPSPVRARRVPGTCKDILTIVEDDDEHLENFKEYM